MDKQEYLKQKYGLLSSKGIMQSDWAATLMPIEVRTREDVWKKFNYLC